MGILDKVIIVAKKKLDEYEDRKNAVKGTVTSDVQILENEVENLKITSRKRRQEEKARDTYTTNEEAVEHLHKYRDSLVDTMKNSLEDDKVSIKSVLIDLANIMKGKNEKSAS